ncbi:hypothetical protein [Chitinophaga sp. CB10]|uniref:hypothetical protein n=1 Tax=Chitinophaga sp. CB10 TaxID=1891659 RepID=UPI0025BCB488|nr:hypothetical protein [Chitinophaga sp. CB10]
MQKIDLRTFITVSSMLLSVVIFFFGCEATSSEVESKDFSLLSQKADDFFVLTSSLDDKKQPRTIIYLFSGRIQNNTPNIIAHGVLTMSTYLKLENGTIITEKEVNRNLFGGILSIASFRNLKPRENYDIQKLESISIPVEYAAYPVKDVVIKYSLETEDQINQISEKKVIKSISVIDKWRKAVDKVNSGKIDADDYSFPGSVIR